LKHVRMEKNNCEQHLTEFRYELMHRPNSLKICDMRCNEERQIFYSSVNYGTLYTRIIRLK